MLDMLNEMLFLKGQRVKKKKNNEKKVLKKKKEKTEREKQKESVFGGIQQIHSNLE